MGFPNNYGNNIGILVKGRGTGSRLHVDYGSTIKYFDIKKIGGYSATSAIIGLIFLLGAVFLCWIVTEGKDGFHG